MLNSIKSKLTETGIYFKEDKNCLTFPYTDFTLYIFENGVIIYSPSTPNYPLRCPLNKESVETALHTFFIDYNEKYENLVVSYLKCAKIMYGYYAYKNVMFGITNLKLDITTDLRTIKKHISGMHPSNIASLIERENALYTQALQLYRDLVAASYKVIWEGEEYEINQTHTYNIITQSLTTNNTTRSIAPDRLLDFLKNYKKTDYLEELRFALAKQGYEVTRYTYRHLAFENIEILDMDEVIQITNGSIIKKYLQKKPINQILAFILNEIEAPSTANVVVRITNTSGKKEHYTVEAGTIQQAIFRLGLNDRTDIITCTIAFQGRKKE